MKKSIFVAFLFSALAYLLFYFNVDSSKEIHNISDNILKHDFVAETENKKLSIESKDTIDSFPNEKEIEHIIFPAVNYDRSLWDSIEQLIRESSAGNNTAKYILGVSLAQCIGVPTDRNSLEEELSQLKTALNDSSSQGFSENTYLAQENLKRKFYFCDGIDRNEVSNYFKYLQDAAESGYVPAMSIIGDYQNPDLTAEKLKLLESSEVRSALEADKKWKEDLREISAAKGSIKAMFDIAVDYQQGHKVERDYVKAYAYSKAILKFSKKSKYRDFIYSNLSKLEVEMSDNELKEANLNYMALVREISKNGEIYHDS